jgi:hypothetical protein
LIDDYGDSDDGESLARTGFNTSGFKKGEPQGLKPAFLAAAGGTAEEVAEKRP